jgi:hypothetical protein
VDVKRVASPRGAVTLVTLTPHPLPEGEGVFQAPVCIPWEILDNWPFGHEPLDVLGALSLSKRLRAEWEPKLGTGQRMHLLRSV